MSPKSTETVSVPQSSRTPKLLIFDTDGIESDRPCYLKRNSANSTFELLKMAIKFCHLASSMPATFVWISCDTSAAMSVDILVQTQSSPKYDVPVLIAACAFQKEFCGVLPVKTSGEL